MSHWFLSEYGETNPARRDAGIFAGVEPLKIKGPGIRIFRFRRKRPMGRVSGCKLINKTELQTT